MVFLLCKKVKKKLKLPQYLNLLFKNAHFQICSSGSVYCEMVWLDRTYYKLYGLSKWWKTPLFSTKIGPSRTFLGMTVWCQRTKIIAKWVVQFLLVSINWYLSKRFRDVRSTDFPYLSLGIYQTGAVTNWLNLTNFHCLFHIIKCIKIE